MEEEFKLVIILELLVFSLAELELFALLSTFNQL
jgi:hypothetical protein